MKVSESKIVIYSSVGSSNFLLTVLIALMSILIVVKCDPLAIRACGFRFPCKLGGRKASIFHLTNARV